MKRYLVILLAVCGAWFAGGCSPGGSTTPPPVATHFTVTPAANTATAGTAFNFTVAALDASNAVVSTFTGTVHFTSSDGKAVLPADASLTNGTGSFSATLKTAGNQTITATASISGTSSSIAVTAAAASQFSVGTPASATAGTAFSFTVSAQDASGNLVSTYSGTVHFTSSDPQATLPTNATLTNGTGSFSATLKTATGQTITATDIVTSSITGNSPVINVSSTPITTHFAVTAPASASAGIQFMFTVKSFDAFNNVVPTYTGTVHFTSSDPQAVLPADTTLANGMGSLSGTLKTIQTTSITATDTATASITGMSSPISVVSNAATHLAVTVGATASAITRAAFSFGVSALDVANNVSVGYSGTVKLTSSDAQAMFAANPVTLLSGTGQFKATFETAGSQTITATDTVVASIRGVSGPIAVTASSSPSITSSAPPNGTFADTYGPVTTEQLKCTSSFFGFPANCKPCTNSSGCSSLPPCTGRGSKIPCVITKQVQLGFQLAANGGVPPYQWQATGLPPGLALSVVNNTTYISGSPNSPGTYNITVTATDSGNPSMSTPSSNYTIVISDPAPPVIAPTVPPNGGVNDPYSFTFTASSSAPPLTWRVSAGTTPVGLTFTPNGILSGTPTAVGTSSITLIATDTFKQDSAPQTFNIQIFAHGFVATGSMAAARAEHTATLLNNGKVLVAGGIDPTGVILASSELYDPVSKSFSTSGSMGAGRRDFTATLLPSGKVLVTGGLASAGPLTSAEIYDPIAGTFAATTGPMTIARASHTATLLNTGKVLIAGGASIGGFGTFTAELFDPATGTFTETGSMLVARSLHTATLLGDGRVLIAGGSVPGGQILAECELYDPTSGSFLQTLGSMATARASHTATLLKDGTVLVTGGVDGATAMASATAEVFNLATQMFTTTKGNMATARVDQTATRLGDGTVLVAGGNTAATAEVYDPIAGTFSPTGGMTASRDLHTANLLTDGTALLAGGTNGAALASAELYK